MLVSPFQELKPFDDDGVILDTKTMTLGTIFSLSSIADLGWKERLLGTTENPIYLSAIRQL